MLPMLSVNLSNLLLKPSELEVITTIFLERGIALVNWA